MSKKATTISNIKTMINTSLKHKAIIENLKLQNKEYGCDTKLSVEARKKSLNKLEGYLKDIKKEKNLLIEINALIGAINKYLPEDKNATFSKYTSTSGVEFCCITINSKNKTSKMYSIAPLTSIKNGIYEINLLDALPSSLNVNYCTIFDDFNNIDECFYKALAQTIRERKKMQEFRLVDKLIKAKDKQKEYGKIIDMIGYDIEKAQRINKKISTLNDEEIRVDDLKN